MGGGGGVVGAGTESRKAVMLPGQNTELEKKAHTQLRPRFHLKLTFDEKSVFLERKKSLLFSCSRSKSTADRCTMRE